MTDKKEDKKRFIYIELEAQNSPTFKPIARGEYISYGDNNDYPNYIIDMYQRCAEHNSIINSKVNYVFGKGLTYKPTNDVKIDGKLEQFISRANSYEGWNDMLPKTIINFEQIDGFYFQFVFGKGGKVVDVYNMDMTRIRKAIEGGYWYCEDWSDAKKIKEKKWYPEYSKQIKTGSAIYYCKIYKPSNSRFGDTYSVPNYIGALNAIETDINIDVFYNSLTQNGMTAQGMLTLFNGEPPGDEEAKQIEKDFKKKYTGAKKAGGFIINFVNPDGKAAEVTNFSASDLDKQFELLGKRVREKITSGHRIDPVLIGIDTATSWSRPQLLDKWERFNTEYVTQRQNKILEVIRLIAEEQGVASGQLYFEALPPIGEEIELGSDVFKEVLTVSEQREYLRDKKGVSLTSIDEDTGGRLSLAQKLGVGGSQSLQALIIDPNITPDQKLNIMVGLYSVPEKKARKMLGLAVLPVEMSVYKDEILEAFKLKAKDDSQDEVLEMRFVHGSVDEEQAFKFDEVLGGTVKEVRNQILDLLAGDPFVKPELIAKQLGTDVDYVKDQLSQLKEQGILQTSGKGFLITDKGLNRAENVEPVIETEIYTVYQYALSPKADYHNSKGYKETSHEFCIEMMKMANSGKVWTREDIDSISNEFGENAWIYRGGFTGRTTGKVTPYCNHVWKSITKVRRKNG